MENVSGRTGIIDVARPSGRKGRMVLLRDTAASRRLSVLSLLAGWAAVRWRQGLSIEEYLGLQLFDRRFYGAADKSAFVGVKGARRILLQANERFDLYGLIDNKIACDFLLAAHGLPVMPTVALYRQATGRASPFLLRSRDDLRAFLSDGGRYPLFGKPLSGRQSLGAASFTRYDPARDALVSFDGREVALDGFMREIETHYASGYLFQRRLSPHAAVRALCGDRLATIRVLTAMTRAGPKVLRAAWKIPAGSSAADNFWRVGNLLCQLDLATGRVQSVVRTTAAGFEEATHHPDTGAALIGTQVPDWPQILHLAREGAGAIDGVALLGWDIAPTDAGAVIVEANQIPDFRLHQIADRRGILDAAMIAFLRERKAHSAEWRRRQAGR